MRQRTVIKLIWASILGASLFLLGTYAGLSLAKHQHEIEIQECADELLGPNKCRKLWDYAVSLEEENAALNLLLRSCRDGCE